MPIVNYRDKPHACIDLSGALGWLGFTEGTFVLTQARQSYTISYPEGYEQSLKGDIYGWADKVSPEKPTGIGEFLTHYGRNGNVNQWWQGTLVRGLRYVGFADIRPYRLDWAWMTDQNTPKIINLRNSLAPVALFGKEYDR